MGVVWKAEDIVLGRIVAIKVLPADVARDEKRRSMFFEEARLASSLSEAHIVQVHEFGREGDLDFIVMEFIDGKPLNRLMQGRPLPPDKVADFGHQIARALSKAHNKGLLHRDLKPSNVLVTEDGDLKLVDFGLAVLFGRDDESVGTDVTTQTFAGAKTEKTQHVMGTLPYMSPEQLRGGKLDARSDIFSLGTVLYEMTTGQRPFTGPTGREVIEEILKSRPKPVQDLVPRVPMDLGKIIAKALSRKRGDRYQNTEDMAVDLKRLGKDLETGSLHSYEDLIKSTRPKRRWWTLAATALVSSLTVAMLIWWFVLGRVPAGDPSTILILPLEMRGQADQEDYLGRAFSEAIAVNLTQAEDLKILPVSGSRPSTEGPRALWHAATALGAGQVLNGSLQRSGGIMRVSINLTDVSRNRMVWGTQKDVPTAELTELASEFARQIAEKVGSSLGQMYRDPRFDPEGSPGFLASVDLAKVIGAVRRKDKAAMAEATRRLAEQFPEETDAMVLRAQALKWNSFGAKPSSPEWIAFEESLIALERVDSGNPWEAIIRAQSVNQNQFLTSQNPSRHEVAFKMFGVVLARDDLGPRLRSSALVARGECLIEMGEFDAARVDLEEARRLNPMQYGSYLVLSYVLGELGRLGESEEYARQGLALAPLDADAHGFLAWPLMQQRRLEEAVAHARMALKIDPANSQNHWTLGIVLEKSGDWEEAVGLHRTACRITPTQDTCGHYARALVHTGKPKQAREAVEKAVSLPEDDLGAYQLALYWALAGDWDRALRQLRRYMEIDGNPNYGDLQIVDEPDLDSLRGETEFQEIVDEVRRRVRAKGILEEAD